MGSTEPLNQLGEVDVKLPPDFTTEIPDTPYKWVSQFLSATELIEHIVGWSEELQRLIFPIYSPDQKYHLLFWTGRYFGSVKTAPKYYTMGERSKVLHIIPSEVISEKLVLTEDIVSAIKVSRQCSAMPLFGTNMPLEHATTLSKRFSELVVWLDPDMKATSIKQALKLEPWFERTRCIFSEKDPKAHTDQEIGKYLGAV